MKSHKLLFAILAAGIAALIWAAFFWQAPAAKPSPAAALASAQALPEGGDFTLHSAAGPVTLDAYRGQVVVIYFGYAFCPDACPTSLAALAAALSTLAPEALAQVRGLLISVDPERDTLEILKDYAPYFHPSITGVTGTPAEIAQVTRQYGVIYAKQKADVGGHYSVDHSSFLYVVAPDGKLAYRLAHGTAPAEIAAAIESVLKSAKAR